MKVLAIGNSFSQDATHYLHQIAAADDVQLKVVNLYIPGCSLERHWNNILSDAEEYVYEENGESTDELISIGKALKSEKWDYVVTQQASYDSGLIETYHPFIEKIAKYVKDHAPQAEFLLHETWAYEIDSSHEKYYKYDKNQKTMYEKLSSAYKSVAKQLGVRLIPCGDIIQELRTKEPFRYGHGGMSICRDGFHMNFIYGRYLLSAIWYKFLTGNKVGKNTYIPHTGLAPNAICDEKVLNVIKSIVDGTSY